MRVAIDATALGSRRGGDETLLRGLLCGLAEVTPDDGSVTYSLYLRPGACLPRSVADRPEFRARTMPWGPSPLRYAVTLPRLLSAERHRPDLLYSQTHAPPFASTPQVLQLTDLSFHHHPEFYPLPTRLRMRTLVPFHARRARAILIISEFSRRDLIQSYGLSPERIFTVPCALPRREQVQPLTASAQGAWLARLGISAPFFLYVGNLHPRKNVPRLIEAFGQARRASGDLANYQLVIAGGHWWNAGDETRAAQQAPPGSVVMTGRVSDQDRERLLQAARGVAYPSLFEGFGLPPLEAMSVGTPVLASNAAAIPEVVGDAALLVNPLDVDDLARGLVRLATDENLRTHLRERGFVRASHFTTRAAGEGALAAFHWASSSPHN